MLFIFHVAIAIYVITRSQRFPLGIFAGVVALLAAPVGLFLGPLAHTAASTIVLVLAVVATYKAFAAADLQPPDTSEHREASGTAMTLLALTMVEAMLLTVRGFIFYVANT